MICFSFSVVQKLCKIPDCNVNWTGANKSNFCARGCAVWTYLKVVSLMFLGEEAVLETKKLLKLMHQTPLTHLLVENVPAHGTLSQCWRHARAVAPLMPAWSWKGRVFVAWLRFVYSLTKWTADKGGKAGLSSLLMQAGFTGALLTGIDCPHSQQAQWWYAMWWGKKEPLNILLFFFWSNGRRSDRDVLTGIFQLIFLNGIHGMFVVWVQSKYKQKMWAECFYIFVYCICSCLRATSACATDNICQIFHLFSNSLTAACLEETAISCLWCNVAWWWSKSWTASSCKSSALCHLNRRKTSAPVASNGPFDARAK